MALMTAPHGRLGNNIAAVLHILYFADFMRLKRVKFLDVRKSWRHMAGFMPSLPIIDIKPEGPSACTRNYTRKSVPPHCAHPARQGYGAHGYGNGKWSGDVCFDVPAVEYHRVFKQHMLPFMTSDCKKVIQTVNQLGPKSLLIHLRAEDIYSEGMAGKPGSRLWNQPPCAMYEKIIREGGYTHILVVTDPKRRHNCIKWLEEHPMRREGVSIEMQSNSVWNDYCTLMGAQNIVVSDSSFAQTAAIFARPLTIHMFGFLFYVAQNLFNCKMGSETKVLAYKVPNIGRAVTDKYPQTLQGFTDFQLSYNWTGIVGPLPCGSEYWNPQKQR